MGDETDNPKRPKSTVKARRKPADRMSDGETEQFILVWQTSRDKEEVAERLGISQEVLHNRARWLVQKKVPLKKLYRRNVPRGRDWDRFRQIALEALPKPEGRQEGESDERQDY